MTLSEFDRRCRGYHRRHAAHAAPLRWLGTILLNAHRGPKDAAMRPEEAFWLYGDPPPPEPPKPLTAEEVEAEFARTRALDADLV